MPWQPDYLFYNEKCLIPASAPVNRLKWIRRPTQTWLSETGVERIFFALLTMGNEIKIRRLHFPKRLERFCQNILRHKRGSCVCEWRLSLVFLCCSVIANGMQQPLTGEHLCVRLTEANIQFRSDLFPFRNQGWNWPEKLTEIMRVKHQKWVTQTPST